MPEDFEALHDDARRELIAIKRALDAAAIVAITDAKGVITYVNDKFCEISKYSRDELIGRTHKVINSGHHPKPFFEDLWKTIESGKIWKGDIKNRAKDGTDYWVATTIVPFLDGNGKPYQYLAIRDEITARKRAEESLEKAVRELQDLKHALDAAAIVAITDADGVITYVNDTFCGISKYSREELIGRTHQIINSGYHSKEFFRELWQTIENGHVWRGDIRNRAKDGTQYWVATTIVPFLGPTGKPYQYLAIRNEITARKQAEDALERAVRELAEMSERERQRAEALQAANKRIVEEQAKVVQAEKLSSIGLLAAGVAHEINNPLAGVMSCVRALRDGTVTGDRREEYFEAVRDGLERIKHTVQGLLDFARPQAATVGEVDCYDVVSSCLLLIASQLRKKTVEAEVKFREGDVRVRGNRQQLMQAALNVLLNALHASPAGKKIEIVARRHGAFVDLTFSDEGRGIPKEHLARVTDPFYTTKDQGEGTGLGLTVTLSILQAHGGQLKIDSEVGQGTDVTFRLPAAS